MPRLSDKQMARRRAKVYQGIVAGKSLGQIRAELGVSDDTVARDLAAVGDDLLAWARQELTGTLAYVVANYKLIITEAWEKYHEECRREREWLEGKFDRTVQVADPVDGARVERKAPPFRVLKVAWLNSMRETLAQLAKLGCLSEERVARLLDAEEDEDETADMSERSEIELRALVARGERGIGAA